MAGTKIVCATCGDRFIGRSNATYCSAPCRKRAYRARSGANRPVSRPADVTVTEPPSGHCREAQAVIDALNSEMASHADLLGQPLKWSAAEAAILELIAETFDRRADIQRRYEAADDDRAAVRFSAELRLLEQSAARLLKQVRTEPPAPRSLRSVKAARAAHARWDRGS